MFRDVPECSMFLVLSTPVYWWGRREREELHQNQPVKLTRFILLTRKAVLHSSWCSSLSLSIYNCLVFFSKNLLLKSSLYICWWSLIIGLHIMRRMYVPRKTSHKTYASLVNYLKGRNVHLKDNYLPRDVKFGDNMSHSQKAHC